MFLQSICVIEYLFFSKPFIKPSLNNLEIFNEICIVLVTYPTLLFTGYIDADPEFQYSIGWGMIIIIIVNILINCLIVLFETLRDLKNNI